MIALVTTQCLCKNKIVIRKNGRDISLSLFDVLTVKKWSDPSMLLMSAHEGPPGYPLVKLDEVVI
jgi:hypothetical protein